MNTVIVHHRVCSIDTPPHHYVMSHMPVRLYEYMLHMFFVYSCSKERWRTPRTHTNMHHLTDTQKFDVRLCRGNKVFLYLFLKVLGKYLK